VGYERVEKEEDGEIGEGELEMEGFKGFVLA
jgi:hypothetical protein